MMGKSKSVKLEYLSWNEKDYNVFDNVYQKTMY